MRLHVERESIFFDALDDVRFPERTVAVQARAVKTRDEGEHLSVSARFRECGVAHVVMGVEVVVGDPVRQPQSPKGPCELLVERRLYGIRVIIAGHGLVQPVLVHPLGVAEQHEATRMHRHLTVLGKQEARVDGSKWLHRTHRSIPPGPILVASAPLK